MGDHIEAVFQISIKVQLASGIIGKLSTLSVGYTNRSFWQAYNSDISRPFRETNHEPELMLNWQTKNNWIDAFGVSLNHQSNGQTSYRRIKTRNEKTKKNEKKKKE